MSFALAAGTEPIAGFRCVRRLGRSAHGETWLMQSEDESYRALKWIYDGAGLRHAKKLTSYRHPFLVQWERSEIKGSDLLLITDWAEETLDIEVSEAVAQGRYGVGHKAMIRYMSEIAEALDYLHIKHKMVHGRLKISQVGIWHHHAKLLDWGLRSPDKLTTGYWSLEDLQTTAPEVLAGELEPMSDQFSLAALYLQATLGKFPLPAENFPEFFQQRLAKTVDPKQMATHACDALVRAFHAEPNKRFPTCAAFVKAMEGDVDTVSTVAPAPPMAKVISQGPAPTEEPERIWSPRVSDSDSETAAIEAVPTVMIKSMIAIDKNRHPDSAFLNLNSLAYHSKVQSFGILTPTIIVGMGRMGHAVLQELNLLFHERFDGVATLPHIRLLAVDLIPAGTYPAVSSKPGHLQGDQVLFLPEVAGEKVAVAEQWLGATSWLPRERVEKSTPSLSRLSVVSGYTALRERLQRECKIMLQSESMRQSKENTDLSVRQDLIPCCYLIGSLEEDLSTGAGADVAYLLRQVISELGWGQAHMNGLFFLPEENADTLQKARSYAAITELHHYTQEQFFSAQYFDGLEITAPQTPFDAVFFRKVALEGKPLHGHPDVSEAANWLLRDVTTELGSLRLASRETTRSYAESKTPWFSHGAAVLQSSHHALEGVLRRQLLGRLVGHWIDLDPETKEIVKTEGERFVEENIHPASSLLDRFQHLVALVLGREPAHLIEEWIAPLRKGAAARPPLEVVARDILQNVELNFGTNVGHHQAPTMVAIQQEADALAEETASRIKPFLLAYLDRPGMRLGAAIHLGRLLLHWVNHQLEGLQSNHADIHSDMIRCERTITQMMSQEERSFAIMGRQRLVSQIVQDLSEYPTRVLKEDIFARAVYVFQTIKTALEETLKELMPAERTLKELQNYYSSPSPMNTPHLLLDGEATLNQRIDSLIAQLPEDVYLKLDNDLSEALVRFQSNYHDVCMGKGPSFPDILALLDNSIEECLEGMLPSEDAAEQLLTLPSQAVVEQLRNSYRHARPDLIENKQSREGAYCLMVTSNSDAGQELLQMAQATLPQIVSAPEGFTGEILFYRETGCLMPHEIYPEGQDAYRSLMQTQPHLIHSRYDIGHWHPIAPSTSTHHFDTFHDEPAEPVSV
ncbi:MAG: tubulin-like doman-containing protein [Gemmatales bacterium]